jgi:hypothetical protein
VPLDLSNNIELVARTGPTSIRLGFVNCRSASAKSERVCLVHDLSLLVGDDSVANVFRGESELNHGCRYLAEAINIQHAHV